MKNQTSIIKINFSVIAGASLNTDIGPDSEAHITPAHDDEDKSHVQTEHFEHDEQNVDDIKDTHIKNGKHDNNGQEIKTNTPV